MTSIKPFYSVDLTAQTISQIPKPDVVKPGSALGFLRQIKELKDSKAGIPIADAVSHVYDRYMKKYQDVTVFGCLKKTWWDKFLIKIGLGSWLEVRQIQDLYDGILRDECTKVIEKLKTEESWSLSSIPSILQKNKDVLMAACGKDWKHLQHVPVDHLDYESIALRAIKTSPSAYKLVKKYFEAIELKKVDEIEKQVSSVPKEQQDDLRKKLACQQAADRDIQIKNFVKKAIQANIKVYEFLDLPEMSDEDVKKFYKDECNSKNP